MGQLLSLVERNVRMTTGSNLRTIMLQAGLNRLEELGVHNCDFDYNKVTEEDSWRIQFLKEILETRDGDLVVPGMDAEDLKHIMDYLCTS